MAELLINANSAGVRISGNIQTLLKLTCHRCLQPYFLNINLQVDESFTEYVEESLSERAPRDRELLHDDFVEQLPADDILDISDLVYQAVTLATPVSCLCGDDCPGPAFPDGEAKSGSLAADKDTKSQEHRIDPRWKNLKTLFPNEETE